MSLLMQGNRGMDNEMQLYFTLEYKQRAIHTVLCALTTLPLTRPIPNSSSEAPRILSTSEEIHEIINSYT